MNAFDLELYGKSNYDLAAELGARFRAYRIALRMTRMEMAEKAGVSAMTLARFENGNTSSISLSNFIGLLRAIKHLDRIVETIPEIPDSLYHKPRKPGVTQRVRRKKDEK
jgi:transcriptional regulator with XRE-family HTH domain